MNNDRPIIYIIAGEPSGDALGAKLIAAIRRAVGDSVAFAGIGGERMQAEGVTSLFPMKEISLMGFVEILPHIPNVLKRLRQTVEEVERIKPDIVVTIDSPGFNKRVAKKLKGKGIPLVHYVAPTVWAYRPERAKSFAELFDHILLLLPFESPYFQEVGLPCTYVGHPVIEDWQQPGDRAGFRKKHNIPENVPLLALLPGSRPGEIEKHLPVFRDTVNILKQRYPGLRVVSVTPPEMAGTVLAGMKDWPVPPVLVTNRKEKHDAFAAADIALAKSGTVALELALAAVPTIITYKVSLLSAFAMRKMIRVRFVNLINILMRREVIPELLQEFCRPELLADALDALLENPEEREWQVKKSWEALQMLGLGEEPTPSERAAHVVLNVMAGAVFSPELVEA